MVAQLKPESAPLSLLFGPDRSGFSETQKMRYLRRFLTEEGLDFGARVQHAIAMYILAGSSRSEVARFLGMSERQTQDVILGRAWEPYSRPILRALAGLGITLRRGRWYGPRARHDEIIAASQAVMRRAIEALEGPEIPLYDRDRLLADLRLLTVAAEDRP